MENSTSKVKHGVYGGMEDRAVNCAVSNNSPGGSVAEYFRALALNSGGPWLKSSTLLLSGFDLGSPEFNSSTMLCK